LPLLVPREYIPVDPLNPYANPAPEQTTSWLSFSLFSFLDPLVLLANRSSQLSEDEIPPLADYDATPVLVSRSYPILDTFSGAKKQHVALGLIRVFRKEFALLCALTIGKVLSNFAAPLGINRLLAYLEAKGQGATVRPWVWAAWLFVGPLAGSVTFQAYIFLNTRTLVRAEAVITQLVFDHALRVRMKAEAPAAGGTAPPTRAASPTRTEASSAHGEPEEDAETLAASVSTVQAAGQPGQGKGKARAATTDSTATASTAATSSGSAPADAKGGAEAKKADDGEESASANLVGRINNLVTTDLGNIVDGRDFLMLSEPVFSSRCERQ
jgi:hypothetical protein